MKILPFIMPLKLYYQTCRAMTLLNIQHFGVSFHAFYQCDESQLVLLNYYSLAIKNSDTCFLLYLVKTNWFFFESFNIISSNLYSFISIFNSRCEIFNAMILNYNLNFLIQMMTCIFLCSPTGWTNSGRLRMLGRKPFKRQSSREGYKVSISTANLHLKRPCQTWYNDKFIWDLRNDLI